MVICVFVTVGKLRNSSNGLGLYSYENIYLFIQLAAFESDSGIEEYFTNSNNRHFHYRSGWCLQ